MADDSGVDLKAKPGGHWFLTDAMYWMMLAIAVLAVASFGFTISLIVPLGAFGKLFAFILACWLCTFLGMRLMDNPRMSETNGSPKKKQ